jgi:hypothetical protein
MSEVNRYDYLLVRVEYPRERGYRMEPRHLPDWLHLTITKQGNNKFVTVYSRIHVTKELRMPTSYSDEFSDYAILKDISGEISHRFL